MNQLARLRRTVSVILLVICLVVIVPFEVFNEMESLQISTAEPMVTMIRMINFFDMANVTERSTEAMYVTCEITPADYGFNLIRLVSFIRHKIPVLHGNIKNYSQQGLVLVSMLCFLIFYQSSRTTSEADPLNG